MQDLTIFRYIVFTLWDARDNDFKREKKGEALWTGIQQLWEWFNRQIGNSELSLLASRSLHQQRRESLRLVGADWSDVGELSYTLEVRQIYDSVYFQLGICRKGISQLDDFKELIRKIYDFKPVIKSDLRPVHLGDWSCYYAEKSNQTDLNEFSNQVEDAILTSHQGRIDELKKYSFDWGYLTIPNSFLYPFPFFVLPFNNQLAIDNSSEFMHSIVPRLIIYFMKIRWDFQEYERERPVIEENEQDLAQELFNVPGKTTLEIHEEKVIQLTAKHHQLIEDVGCIKQRMSAMKANITNIQLLSQEIQGVHQRTDLENYFLHEGRIAIEQIERDLEFFKARDDEAHLTLETLNTLIGVERGKFERERNEYEQLVVKILGIIGLVLAMIDGFAEEFAWYTKVAIVVGGAILGLVWFLKARRKMKPKVEVL